MAQTKGIVSNQYGEHNTFCPSCEEKGVKNNGHWICVNDDCRVLRFFVK